MLSSMSLKSKLVLMLLAVAIGCILIIGYQGLDSGEKALKDRIDEQLVSIRESKSFQIESWYSDLVDQVKILGANHTTVYAMREFKDAFDRLSEDKVKLSGGIKPLEEYYKDEFFSLVDGGKGEPLLDVYLPQRLVSQKLQTTYIAANPFPVGEKNRMVQPEKSSYYNNTHGHYHPVFNQFLNDKKFYDLFLVDFESGNIVYSAYKEAEYATSLKTGPYRNSNLGQLYKKIANTQNYQSVISVDFDFHKPSYGKPSMFMGTTIFDLDYRPIGMLIIQASVDALDRIMVGRGWESQGLGETGEAYLVGEDGLMRSDSRLLKDKAPQKAKEEGVCYAQALQEKRLLDTRTAEHICQFKTSILLQPVDGEHIERATKGLSGNLTVSSYAGEEALVSYKPLFLGGMKWVITAKIDASEAYAPIRAFQKKLGVSAIIIASVVTFLAMLLSTLFLRPLHFLIQEVRNLSNGSNDLHVDIDRGDEYGELADAMNMTGEVIKKQGETIAFKEAQNKRLLLNTLPEKVARQFEAGNEGFAERIESASVLYIDIRGFSLHAETDSPEMAIGLFNRLISVIDETADEHSMDRIKTVGENYLAACGLSVSRLDHAKRSVDFACAVLEVLETFNQQQSTELSMRIGIHCGPVLAGVIGKKRFSYDLCGNTVDIADRIRYEADPNSVIVTEQVHIRLDNSRVFTECPVLQTRALGDLHILVHSPKQVAATGVGSVRSIKVATEEVRQPEPAA